MSRKIADILDDLEFFKDFPYLELESISTYMTLLTVRKGDFIFHEGDPGDHMLILVEGRIAITKGGEGYSSLLCYEGKGRIIGEMALLDRERRSANCVADADCELLTLSDDNLHELAKQYPQLAYRFMFYLARLLSRRLRRTSGVLAEHLVN